MGTGQVLQGNATAGQLVASGVVGLVVGYQAWKFKMRRQLSRMLNESQR